MADVICAHCAEPWDTAEDFDIWAVEEAGQGTDLDRIARETLPTWDYWRATVADRRQSPDQDEDGTLTVPWDRGTVLAYIRAGRGCPACGPHEDGHFRTDQNPADAFNVATVAAESTDEEPIGAVLGYRTPREKMAAAGQDADRMPDLVTFDPIDVKWDLSCLLVGMFVTDDEDDRGGRHAVGLLTLNAHYLSGARLETWADDYASAPGLWKLPYGATFWDLTDEDEDDEDGRALAPLRADDIHLPWAFGYPRILVTDGAFYALEDAECVCGYSVLSEHVADIVQNSDRSAHYWADRPSVTALQEPNTDGLFQWLREEYAGRREDEDRTYPRRLVFQGGKLALVPKYPGLTDADIWEDPELCDTVPWDSCDCGEYIGGSPADFFARVSELFAPSADVRNDADGPAFWRVRHYWHRR